DRLAALVEDGSLKFYPASPAVPVEKTAEPAAIVRMENLHFGYTRGKEILKGISFEMKRGELLAIVGNNGSGKTTLVKNLVGLLKPSSGKVTVCGLDISRTRVDEIARRAAYVFQYPEHQFVAQGQTVSDEIAFNLRMAGRPEEEVGQEVARLVQRFQLEGKEKTSPFLLSGGEMRTLSVACMLTTHPELLILDEPTYGQDRQRICALMERLAELRAGGTSIMMITHDMRLVAEYATSVLLLSNGQGLYYGPPQGLFERLALLRQAALKEPPVCAVARALRERGIPVPRGVMTVPGLLSVMSAS
ncbi:MAG TPA: ABC transporter ATP-binding protein, partial [Anaerolineaceae bacterium]